MGTRYSSLLETKEAPYAGETVKSKSENFITKASTVSIYGYCWEP
jgi:hypothetical protein